MYTNDILCQLGLKTEEEKTVEEKLEKKPIYKDTHLTIFSSNGYPQAKRSNQSERYNKAWIFP